MFRTHGLKEKFSVATLQQIPHRMSDWFGRIKRCLPKLQHRAKIESDFGLKVGDRVWTIKEYGETMTTLKPFKAKVIYIKNDLATVVKEDGQRTVISCYWLTNGNPQYGD